MFIYLDTLYIIHIYVIYVKVYVRLYFICMHRYFLNQCPFTWSDTLAALALNRYFEVHSVSRLGALTRLSIYYICMYVCMCTCVTVCCICVCSFVLFDGKSYQEKLIVSFSLGVKHLHEKCLRRCTSVTMLVIEMVFSPACYHVNFW